MFFYSKVPHVSICPHEPDAFCLNLISGSGPQVFCFTGESTPSPSPPRPAAAAAAGLAAHFVLVWFPGWTCCFCLLLRLAGMMERYTNNV